MSDEPKIEIGSVCPPIGSWFFPLDPDKKPYPLEDKEKKEDGDSAQSS